MKKFKILIYGKRLKEYLLNKYNKDYNYTDNIRDLPEIIDDDKNDIILFAEYDKHKTILTEISEQFGIYKTLFFRV